MALLSSLETSQSEIPYSELYQTSEAEWRYSFLKMVLNLEGTPRGFMPPLRSLPLVTVPSHS